MAPAVTSELASPLLLPPAPAAFGDSELDGVPASARRYLLGAIERATPLARAAWIEMRGRIKLGRWLPFRATEILAPHAGFVWAARVGGIMTGFDRYSGGDGEMRWKALGLVPVMHASGPDISRSAAGRAAAEAVWVPTALLPRFGVRWSELDDHTLTARFALGAAEIEAELELDEGGRLRSVGFDRWGDPEGTGRFGLHRFGLEVSRHASFDGVVVPSEGRAGWFHGSDRFAEGEFFRFELTALRLVRDAEAAP